MCNALLGIVAALLPGNAFAAMLTVSSVANVSPGQTLVPVPILLANGLDDAVSGIEVDVEFDPTVLTLKSVTTGAAASSAGKHVSSNILDSGITRVIVAGLNQDAIEDGDVAVVSFAVLADAVAGASDIALSDPRLVSPIGTEVPVEAVAGSVTVVRTGEGEGEGEGEGHVGCTGVPSGSKHTPDAAEWARVALAIGILLIIRAVGKSRERA